MLASSQRKPIFRIEEYRRNILQCNESWTPYIDGLRHSCDSQVPTKHRYFATFHSANYCIFPASIAMKNNFHKTFYCAPNYLKTRWTFLTVIVHERRNIYWLLKVLNNFVLQTAAVVAVRAFGTSARPRAQASLKEPFHQASQNKGVYPDSAGYDKVLRIQKAWAVRRLKCNSFYLSIYQLI